MLRIAVLMTMAYDRKSARFVLHLTHLSFWVSIAVVCSSSWSETNESFNTSRKNQFKEMQKKDRWNCLSRIHAVPFVSPECGHDSSPENNNPFRWFYWDQLLCYVRKLDSSLIQAFWMWMKNVLRESHSWLVNSHQLPPTDAGLLPNRPFHVTWSPDPISYSYTGMHSRMTTARIIYLLE